MNQIQDYEGSLKLWKAVLFQAFKDASWRKVKVNSVYCRSFDASARKWLFDNDSGVVNLARLVSVNLSLIRKLVLKCPEHLNNLPIYLGMTYE